MRWRLFFRGFFRTLFILYCVEAGIFLVILPWREVWDRILVDLPPQLLQTFLLSPLGRAAISGFGLVHLIWGAHDLEDLLLHRSHHGTTEISGDAVEATRSGVTRSGVTRSGVTRPGAARSGVTGTQPSARPAGRESG